MTDLVGLARRYVALSDELESIRGEIAKAVLNGGDPSAPFVNAQRRGGKASQGSRSQLQSRQESQPSVAESHRSREASRGEDSQSPSGAASAHGRNLVRNAGATIDDQREAAQDARQGLGQARRRRVGRQRLTPEEIADLLSPVTVAHEPWLPPIYASLARDVAGRHSEPDDRTAAQKAVHARSARRKAMEANRTTLSAWA